MRRGAARYDAVRDASQCGGLHTTPAGHKGTHCGCAATQRVTSVSPWQPSRQDIGYVTFIYTSRVAASVLPAKIVNEIWRKRVIIRRKGYLKILSAYQLVGINISRDS